MVLYDTRKGEPSVNRFLRDPYSYDRKLLVSLMRKADCYSSIRTNILSRIDHYVCTLHTLSSVGTIANEPYITQSNTHTDVSVHTLF